MWYCLQAEVAGYILLQEITCSKNTGKKSAQYGRNYIEDGVGDSDNEKKDLCRIFHSGRMFSVKGYLNNNAAIR